MMTKEEVELINELIDLKAKRRILYELSDKINLEDMHESVWSLDLQIAQINKELEK